ncbi:hypothetical protein I316_02112 [Kwoniella heveanensis BCC8398]|uniref:Xylanolytic transcriptional activator regulatory domain-containing protein n=1 Tax=Kwoniella heveanensis BCC8398 TaxID=1296120 RepID=A0A1B9GYZ5_9TREE|nr:hypothetical protein I316_02112 [Kwoniella heveanensis BCC8398]
MAGSQRRNNTSRHSKVGYGSWKVSKSPLVVPRAAVGAIQISETGSVAHYGPTSAYMHLPDAATRTYERESEESNPGPQRLVEVDWPAVSCETLAPILMLHMDTNSHSALLSLFFSYLNPWCYWCQEAEFIFDMAVSTHCLSSHPIRSSRYSPFLHNIILALAILNAPEILSVTGQDPREIAQSIVSHVVGMIGAELSQPETTTAKGLMLLGSFFFHNRQRNEGWLYANMGVRMAQLLGLGADCQDLVDRGRISAKAKAVRDQTFWTVYCQDILWSFNVGRTPTFSHEDFTTSLPIIDEGDNEKPWEDFNERHSSERTSSRPGWKSSCLHWTAKLCIIGSEIHRSLYRLRQPSRQAVPRVISKLELDLEAWLINLTTNLRIDAWDEPHVPPHIVNMHAVFNYFRILLHRPACFEYAVLDEETRRLSLKACETASREIVRLVGLLPSGRHSTTTLPNIMFTAGTTFLLISNRNDSTPASIREAQAQVDKCIAFLAQMSWPAATIGHDLLKKLRQDWDPLPKDQTEGSLTSTASSLLNDAEALKDPNSEVVKLLIGLGWAPPNQMNPPNDFQPVNAAGNSITPMMTNDPSAMLAAMPASFFPFADGGEMDINDPSAFLSIFGDSRFTI